VFEGPALALGFAILLVTGPAVSAVGASFDSPIAGAWEQSDEILPADVHRPGPHGPSLAFAKYGNALDATGDQLAVAAEGMGEVFVFERTDEGWMQQARIEGSFDAGFGYDLSIRGDLLVIGAPFAGTSSETGVEGEGYGSAYVFERSDQGWEKSARLTASPDPNDEFGREVAIAGELVVIGAPNDETEVGDNAGSVFVLEEAHEEWTVVDRFSGERKSVHLGSSVAAQEDSIAVGVLQGDLRGSDSGSVNLYERGSDGWTKSAELLPEEPTDTFGYDVDLDDGVAIVGAAYSDRIAGGQAGPATNTGSAYVFENDAGEWSLEETFANPRQAPGENFGNAVAVEDGLAVVGARSAEPYKMGAAYVNEKTGQGWTSPSLVTANDTSAQDMLGWAVDIHDESPIVSAPFDDNRRDGTPPPLNDEGDLPLLGVDEGEDAGSVYEFDPSSGTMVVP
jgi:hypothetical protein